MVLNATFNNISNISQWSVILVEETGVPRENHRPVASQTNKRIYIHVFIIHVHVYIYFLLSDQNVIMLLGSSWSWSYGTFSWIYNKANAKRGVSPHLKNWPGDLDLWPWKSIGFQILLRTKYLPSLVKIHWRMLILECAQGCYGRTDGR